MHALDALGSPVRREILVALRERPRAVHELAALFPVSRPAISRHMRLLEGAGLVEAERQGRQSFYSVRPEGFASVRDFIDSFWDVALSRLAKLAEQRVGR